MNKITYHFSRDSMGQWMVYDIHGLYGDMILLKDDVTKHVLKGIDRSGVTVQGESVFRLPVRVETKGFDSFDAKVSIYVLDGEITRVKLTAPDGHVLIESMRNFTIQLEKFEGNPYPWPDEDELPDQDSAPRVSLT